MGGFHTVPHDSVKNFDFSLSKFSTLWTFFDLVLFRLTNSILFMRDRAQACVISMWPPFSRKSDRSANNTTPRPLALTIGVLMIFWLKLRSALLDCRVHHPKVVYVLFSLFSEFLGLNLQNLWLYFHWASSELMLKIFWQLLLGCSRPRTFLSHNLVGGNRPHNFHVLEYIGFSEFPFKPLSRLL